MDGVSEKSSRKAIEGCSFFFGALGASQSRKEAGGRGLVVAVVLMLSRSQSAVRTGGAPAEWTEGNWVDLSLR